MNNNIVKIQIPISEFYLIINSANTLKAQQLLLLDIAVQDKTSYDKMGESLKKVNDAIKEVETARKNVTAPVDAFKKELIKLETDTLAELKQFVEDGKRKMIEYSQ